MRLPKYSGVQATVAFASISFGRSSSTAMNQSSAMRKMSGRVAAPAEGEAVLDLAGGDELSALAQVDDDLLGGLDRAEAVQPAVVGEEAAGLVHGHEHGQVVHARELEVLGAAARRDVDDARALLHGHVLPGDDAVLDLGGGRQVVERALVAQPDELGAPGPARRTPRRARARPPTTRRRAAGRTRPPGSPLRPRWRAASMASSSRPRATGPAGRGAGGGRRATGRCGPRSSRRARAPRSRSRSAGTTRSSGGPCRGSPARACAAGSARCTRCSCRRR